MGWMAREIVFSKKAERGFATIIRALAYRHGEQVALDYQKRILGVLALLVDRPTLFPVLNPEKNARIRKASVDSLTILLYSYTDTELRISDVTEARRDWKKG